MSNIDDLFTSSAQHARRDIPDHPTGWAPGLTLDDDGGVLTAPPSPDPPDWNTLLAEWLPPSWSADDWTVDPESVRFTGWDGWGRDEQNEAATSRKQYSFRARIVPARHIRTVDMSHWRDAIRRAKPSKRKHDGDRALVVCWSDWQIGKADGDGWRGTLDRFVDSIGAMQDRIRDEKPGALYVLSLGDMVEGCAGHYAQQTFTTQLNATQQQEVVTDMIVRGVKDLARHVGRMVVAPVGGNHGEVRRDGKSFTDFADNYDVSLFRHAKRTIAENVDAYGHVSFNIPTRELTQTLDVNGVLVGIVHGHQFAGGGTVEQKAMRWWRGQMEGMQPVGDASILVSGHFHHLNVKRQGSRTWMQAPALDGGSDWFRDVSGLDSPPGTLSFVVESGGWRRMMVT